MVCNRCGASMPNDAAVCRSCGNTLPTARYAGGSAFGGSGSGVSTSFVLWIAGLVAAAAAGIMFLVQCINNFDDFMEFMKWTDGPFIFTIIYFAIGIIPLLEVALPIFKKGMFTVSALAFAIGCLVLEKILKSTLRANVMSIKMDDPRIFMYLISGSYSSSEMDAHPAIIIVLSIASLALLIAAKSMQGKSGSAYGTSSAPYMSADPNVFADPYSTTEQYVPTDSDRTVMLEHTAQTIQFCTTCGRTLQLGEVCLCSMIAQPNPPEASTQFCTNCGNVFRVGEVCACQMFPFVPPVGEHAPPIVEYAPLPPVMPPRPTPAAPVMPPPIVGIKSTMRTVDRPLDENELRAKKEGAKFFVKSDDLD